MVKSCACICLLSVTVLCALLSMAVVNAGTSIRKLNLELDELHRLTLEAGLTAMEARKASAKESKYLDQWNAEITQTMRDVDTAVGSISSVSTATVSTLQATRDTVASLQTPIASANLTLTAATASISDLDALVRNPALTATIAHVESTTGHLDATAADIQAEVHSITHPTLLHKIWGGLLDVAHVFNPL